MFVVSIQGALWLYIFAYDVTVSASSSRSNRPQIKSLYYYVFLFNLICIVNCVVYLIPNQIIVLLCCRAHVGGRFGRRSRLVVAHFALY
jgi:hypothetical protein